MKNNLLMLLLFFAAIILISNGIKIRKVLNEKVEINNEYQIIKKESEIFLNSLTKSNYSIYFNKVILSNKDTLYLHDNKKSSLYFYFPSNECMSCIEQNIFALYDFAKVNSDKEVYILTAKDQIHYISALIRTNRNNSVKFGILSNEIDSKSSFYFFSKENSFSNIFYPEKGNFKPTEAYLKRIAKVL